MNAYETGTPIMVLSLAGVVEYRAEIKKSRFVARARSVTSADDALAFVAEVCEAAATHNCWAYRLGDSYRFADDGEPAGTAGRPILGAIERAGVDRVVVVVTRYFGGIKLGAGGLVRAYGGVAASCLRLAEKRHLRPQVHARLEADFDCVGTLHGLMERHAVEKLAERYTAEGVELEVRLDADRLATFGSALQDASRGTARLERVDEDPQLA